MFAAALSPAASYRNLSIETGVGEARPHRLIEMLFDGAIESVMRARIAMTRHDVATRTRAIGRALRIVDEGLKASLNPAGGELAANLRELYGYITVRLTQANCDSDDAILGEVESLLMTLREGWVGIAGNPAAR